MAALSTIALVATAAASAAGVVSSLKAQSEQKKAAAQALKQQKQAQAAAEQQAAQANNKANQKSPDTAGILQAAAEAGKAGASSTMLTGSQGVDPAALQLGKNTLLGS